VKVAFELTHCREVSHDLVQDAFAHIWLNAKKLARHHERSILHYLVKVVRNKSISYYKERMVINKRMAKFQEEVAASTLSVSPEMEMISVETGQQIRNLIVTFPNR